jgi:hypothetical protein
MLFYWLLTGEVDSKHIPTLITLQFDELDNCDKLYGKSDPSTKIAREILLTIFGDDMKDLGQLIQKFNDLNNDSKTQQEDRTNAGRTEKVIQMIQELPEQVANRLINLSAPVNITIPQQDKQVFQRIKSTIENESLVYRFDQIHNEGFPKIILKELFELPIWYNKPSNQAMDKELHKLISYLMDRINQYHFSLIQIFSTLSLKDDEHYVILDIINGHETAMNSDKAYELYRQQIEDIHASIDLMKISYNELVNQYNKLALAETSNRGDIRNYRDITSSDPYDELLEKEFCNLFVCYDDNTYNGNYFTFDRTRALTEYIESDISEEFSKFTDEQKTKIKNLPAIFAYEYKKDETVQNTFIGSINKLRVHDNNVIVYFTLKYSIPSDMFYNMMDKLDIEKWEKTRTHWTIKNVNLADEFRETKIDLSQYRITQ